jgi:hypothetical protein
VLAWLAPLLFAFVALAALAVDIGAALVDRAALQSAADAGALEVARESSTSPRRAEALGLLRLEVADARPGAAPAMLTLRSDTAGEEEVSLARSLDATFGRASLARLERMDVSARAVARRLPALRAGAPVPGRTGTASFGLYASEWRALAGSSVALETVAGGALRRGSRDVGLWLADPGVLSVGDALSPGAPAAFPETGERLVPIASDAPIDGATRLIGFALANVETDGAGGVRVAAASGGASTRNATASPAALAGLDAALVAAVLAEREAASAAGLDFARAPVLAVPELAGAQP